MPTVLNWLSTRFKHRTHPTAVEHKSSLPSVRATIDTPFPTSTVHRSRLYITFYQRAASRSARAASTVSGFSSPSSSTTHTHSRQNSVRRKPVPPIASASPMSSLPTTPEGATLPAEPTPAAAAATISLPKRKRQRTLSSSSSLNLRAFPNPATARSGHGPRRVQARRVMRTPSVAAYFAPGAAPQNALRSHRDGHDAPLFAPNVCDSPSMYSQLSLDAAPQRAVGGCRGVHDGSAGGGGGEVDDSRSSYYTACSSLR